MANKNDFKAFALDPNANVLSQASWEALPALLAGFSSGKASSAQVNKAIRQATTIAALVGQFIANSGTDALDNADVNGLVTKFTNALTTNLGLGTASKKNVGTGAGQIPDMSSFGISMQNPGWAKFPSGLIIQWGPTPTGSTARSITYPIPYPANVILVIHFDAGWNSASNGSKWGASNKTQTGFTANTDTALEGGQYFSMGY
ncbi:TPA: hypothetical protein RHW17_003355 [Escherichia coli]|nr:hypothetical protein [Escherichia coli]HDV1660752.1 hypothetical protein [Escherichia coli]HDV2740188.1 hypothetical protein [Escherichia coli]HDV2818007.1 hypothetical protein [Escherichia coli]HDV2826235.1 hypothetical protein [Escherichia coli]